jgi:uncharacterized protein YgbK (DUF1537 family)
MRNQAIPSPIKIVVLDDDPTGIQTIHGCYLLTRWDPELIEEAFRDTERFFYILTNSRAYERQRVREIVAEAVRNVLRVNHTFNQQILFISRSDSTLRSHFPLEVDTIRDTLFQETGHTVDAVFLCPAFFEAGRVTVNDTHYIEEGGRRIPTSDTEFARDSVFGYSSSHLPAYVEEKSGGHINKQQVLSLGLNLLRAPYSKELDDFLQGLHDQNYVAVNAERYDDLYRLTESLLAAVSNGKRYLIQSAASLVKTLSGVSDRPLLGPEVRRLAGPGIVVVGSHVKKTTRQLQALLAHPSVLPMEIDLKGAIDSPGEEIRRLHRFLRECLRKTKTPVVYTPRAELTFTSKEKRLQAGQRISSFLARVVRELPFKPSFVIAKGGITAHAVMVEGLGIAKARVLGQILPGIPVISASEEHESRTFPCVIFPGNVGDERALLHIITVFDSQNK